MQDLWGLINSSIVILVLSGAAGYIKGYIDKYSKTSADKERLFKELLENNKKLIEQNEENKKRDDELKRQLDEISTVVQHITNANNVLLRDRIIQSCRVFIERGCISRMARNNISEMYHWYHDELHGNGLGEIFYQRMLDLPLVDEDMPIVSKMNLDEDIFKGGTNK